MSVLRKRDWSFILLIVAVTIVCIRLGFWQLDRLDQRRTEIQHILERMDQPAVEVTSADIAPDYTYQPAYAVGEFDPQNQIMLENQSLDGQPGFHLITPLRFKQSPGAILVDRGWIPFEAGIEGNLAPYDMSGIVEITGILAPSVEQPDWSFLADPAPEPGDPPLQTWRFPTVDLIQRQIEYPIAPLILVQTVRLEDGPAMPQPDPRIELDEGPHLGYAIQWFLFATIAIIGGTLWIRSRRIKDQEKAT
ncbi:MAG: SURF1 family protein [Anaerolineales bacterium]|jgi:surfeit locus 1 family protein